MEKTSDTLITGIFDHFEARGNKTAFIQRTEYRRFYFSYAELVSNARAISVFLARKGIEKGDRVVLWAPNSPWWAICYFGILLRGGVVVPIDFTSDRERAAFIVERSKAKLVIQSQLKADRLEGNNTLCIETLKGQLVGIEEKMDPTSVSLDGEDIAEIVYTSGTTGEPKGVVLTHRNILENIRQIGSYLEDLPLKIELSSFKFLSILPLSHMLEQTAGFLIPLSNSAAIVYLNTLKPSALREALTLEKVHAIIIVPRLLHTLRASFEQKLDHLKVRRLFEALKAVTPLWLKPILHAPLRRLFGKQFVLFVSGGATLEESLACFWTEAGFNVIEGYGLSECSPVLTANLLEPGKAPSVGKPLPGIEIRLGDDGEILAKGPNISPGYYGEAGIRSNRLEGGEWFPSGDLGSFTAEGNLKIVGRKKDLIVTAAGINVSPERVEKALGKIKGIKESCVIGFDGGEGEEVHAVLIMEPGANEPQAMIASANALLDSEERITGYSLWPGDSFPQTTTLKVKKFEVRETLKKKKGAPSITQNLSDDKLCRLVAQATRVSPSQITEESTLAGELGLMSIGRLELASLIEQEFRIDFEDTLITQHTRIRDLRELVRLRKTSLTEAHVRPWAYSPLMLPIRFLSDYLFHIPIFSYFITWKIQGIEQLVAAMKAGPVLLAPNHLSYSDLGTILYAIPPTMRYRIATAAYEEFFFGEKPFLTRIFRRFAYEYVTLLHGVFMLPTEKGFRQSLKHMGTLVTNGKSILIFPEGGHPVNGVPLPVKKGVGLIAKELHLPVLPIHIEGTDHILVSGESFPQHGVVTIKFGAPIPTTELSADEIVARVEAYIRTP